MSELYPAKRAVFESAPFEFEHPSGLLESIAQLRSINSIEGAFHHGYQTMTQVFFMSDKCIKSMLRSVLGLLVVATSLIFVGCETNDYQPIIFKNKLKELEDEVRVLREELRELKGGSSEVATSDSTGKEKTAVNDESTDSTSKSAEPEITTTPEDEAAARERLENSDVFFEVDEDGYVVEADLLENTNQELVDQLSSFPKLSKLILDGTKVTSETFDSLSKLKNLAYLDIERSVIDGESIGKLKDLPKLTFLQLFKATISEDAMEALSEFPALEQIRCAQTRVGDDELQHLSGLKTLKAIDLSDCNRVSTLGLEALTECPNLVFLKVWGKSIGDRSMDVVAKMKSLKVLGLNDTAVTDEGIAKLSDLDLTEVHLFRTQVGDQGLEVLCSMPNIVHLNLRDTRVSDEGLKQLVALSKLKKLDLSECNSPGVTDASGATFAQLDSLASLNLWSTKFSDDGVESLSGLSNLTWLNLDNTKISDSALKTLEGMDQLTWIHLGKTEITDAAVPSLLKLENLTYLNISYTKISEDGYYELDDFFTPNGCEVVQP
ncbi:MAG: hypothetical protein AAF939_16785 [Planctomycetota bacterium]